MQFAVPIKTIHDTISINMISETLSKNDSYLLQDKEFDAQLWARNRIHENLSADKAFLLKKITLIILEGWMALLSYRLLFAGKFYQACLLSHRIHI